MVLERIGTKCPRRLTAGTFGPGEERVRNIVVVVYTLDVNHSPSWMEDLSVKLLRGLSDDWKIPRGLKSPAQRFGSRSQMSPGRRLAKREAPNLPGHRCIASCWARGREADRCSRCPGDLGGRLWLMAIRVIYLSR